MYALLCVKLCVEVCLLVAGGGYIAMAATNEDVIVNAVAVTFVAEIDDLAFKFVVPKFVAKFMTSLPPLTVCDHDDERVSEGKVSIADGLGQVFGVYFMIALLLAVVLSTTLGWCGA